MTALRLECRESLLGKPGDSNPAWGKGEREGGREGGGGGEIIGSFLGTTRQKPMEV